MLKKSFADDEKRYEAQQESRDGKPAARKKRKAAEQGGKEPKRQWLASEQLYNSDTSMMIEGETRM